MLTDAGIAMRPAASATFSRVFSALSSCSPNDRRDTRSEYMSMSEITTMKIGTKHAAWTIKIGSA